MLAPLVNRRIIISKVNRDKSINLGNNDSSIDLGSSYSTTQQGPVAAASPERAAQTLHVGTAAGSSVSAALLPTAAAAAAPDAGPPHESSRQAYLQNTPTGRPISWRTSVGLTLIWDVLPFCPHAQ